MSSEQVFADLLDRCVTDAAVRIRSNGSERVVGRKDLAGALPLTVRVSEPRFFDRVLCYGNLGMGESFMDGDFVMEEGELYDLLTVLLRNRLPERLKQDMRLLLRVLGTRARELLRGRVFNVRSHYDIGDDLFESFLDDSLTYSCGYAGSTGDSLETLQQNKLERICQKLRLREGERLLDIGCGYGGLLIHAARHHGARGLGVTISKRHYEKAVERIGECGVGDRVSVRLAGYQDLYGENLFDKVVSVGMMEHVQHREYPAYVGTIARLLAPTGRGLIHAIGRTRDMHDHDPFIQRYIFPDSDSPRLSEIAAELERHAMPVVDVENMVRHYAYTVMQWLSNFRARQHALDGRYDARFRRMWEYYFACGIAASRAGHSALWQVLFVKDPAADISLQRI